MAPSKKITLPPPFQHEWYVVVALPDQLLLESLLSQQKNQYLSGDRDVGDWLDHRLLNYSPTHSSLA